MLMLELCVRRCVQVRRSQQSLTRFVAGPYAHDHFPTEQLRLTKRESVVAAI